MDGERNNNHVAAAVTSPLLCPLLCDIYYNHSLVLLMHAVLREKTGPLPHSFSSIYISYILGNSMFTIIFQFLM